MNSHKMEVIWNVKNLHFNWKLSKMVTIQIYTLKIDRISIKLWTLIALDSCCQNFFANFVVVAIDYKIYINKAKILIFNNLFTWKIGFFILCDFFFKKCFLYNFLICWLNWTFKFCLLWFLYEIKIENG